MEDRRKGERAKLVRRGRERDRGNTRVTQTSLVIKKLILFQMWRC